MDSIGRKPLMLWGIILIGLGQFLLCVGFTAGLDESLPLFVVAASVITAGYSLFAPVCWILQVSVNRVLHMMIQISVVIFLVL